MIDTTITVGNNWIMLLLFFLSSFCTIKKKRHHKLNDSGQQFDSEILIAVGIKIDIFALYNFFLQRVQIKCDCDKSYAFVSEWFLFLLLFWNALTFIRGSNICCFSSARCVALRTLMAKKTWPNSQRRMEVGALCMFAACLAIAKS